MRVFIHGVACMLAVSVLCTASAGEEFTWTGAKDNYWTNAANWQVGGEAAPRCPGVVWDRTSTDTVPDVPTGDTARFTGGGKADLPIVLEGLYSIQNVIVTGADAPKYTFGATTDEHLPFETNSTFHVESSVAPENVPIINANIVLLSNIDRYWWVKNPPTQYNDKGVLVTNYVDSIGDQFAYRNDTAGDLVLNGTFGTGACWCRPGSDTKRYAEAVVRLYAEDGALTFNGKQNHSVFIWTYYTYVKNLNVNSEFLTGKTLYLSRDMTVNVGAEGVFGYRAANNAGFNLQSGSDVVVNGSGKVCFAENASGNSFDNHAPLMHNSGSLTINCALTTTKAGNNSYSSKPRIFCKGNMNATGKIVLNVPSVEAEYDGYYTSGQQNLEISSTRAFDKMETLYLCGTDTFFNNNADRDWGYDYAYLKVDWCGTEAETFLTSVSNYAYATPQYFTLRNSGLAPLTAAMTVYDGGADTKVVLDGAVSPIRYAMTIAEATLPVELKGKVEFASDSAFDGVTKLRALGAALTVDSGLTLPTVEIISGENTLTVAGTDTLEFNLDYQDGTLDIVSGKVRLPSLAGTQPAWLTFGGYAVEVLADGTLQEKVAHDVAIAARGDVVPNDVGKAVAITATGEGGDDRLAEAATSVKALIHKIDAPATIAMVEAETLSAGEIGRLANAGALTIGSDAGQGTLRASDTGLVLYSNSKTAAVTVNAQVSAPAPATLVTKGENIVLQGGTAASSSLKVTDSRTVITGAKEYRFTDLLVAMNKACNPRLEIRDGAVVTLEKATAEEITKTFIGGSSALRCSDYGHATVVISNATLKSAVADDYTFNGENADDGCYNSAITVGQYGHGVIRVEKDGVLKGHLVLGNYGTVNNQLGSGALIQNGGYVEAISRNGNSYYSANKLGGFNANSGYYELNGGALTVRGSLVLGVNTSCGVFTQFGGFASISNLNATGAGDLVLGGTNHGQGQLNVFGGTLDYDYQLNVNQSFSGAAESAINVCGNTAVLNMHSREIYSNFNGGTSEMAPRSATLAITDGGRVIAGGMSQMRRWYDSKNNSVGPVTNRTFYVWMDGGVFETGGNYDISSYNREKGDASVAPSNRCINAFLVGPRGATIDTGASTSRAASSRIGFRAPETGVVTGIAGFRPVALPGNFVGAPYASVKSDSGAGAAAVALVNHETRQVTNIVITSGGTGYTAAQVTLSYCGKMSDFATFNCTIGAPVSGSLTVQGEGSFTLSGKSNYTGDTILKGGGLVLGDKDVLPESTTIDYQGGKLYATAAASPTALTVRLASPDARKLEVLTYSDEAPATLPEVTILGTPDGSYWDVRAINKVLSVRRLSGLTINFR